MSTVRLYVDEDVYGAVAPQLRQYGFDAVSVSESGRLGLPDPDQLQWAIGQNRAIFTFNVGDFAQLHYQRLSQGGHHAGIVVSAQVPIGTVIRRLLQLMRSLTAEQMQDCLEYLSNW
jgi:hypothetical protein